MTHVLPSSSAFSFSSPTSSFTNGAGFYLPSSPIHAPAMKSTEHMYNTPVRPHLHRSSTVSSFPATTQPLSPISSSSPPLRMSDAREPDMRRNLYVLGLPSDLNQNEFEELFAPFGNVEHSVIMATLDQFNRRRGFVVLSTHQEACAAIRALSGIQLHGSQLHVSFAVVQRSEGFLDGGDRTRRARTTRMADGRHGSSSPDLPSLHTHSLSSFDYPASPPRNLTHGLALSTSTQPPALSLFPQPQSTGGTLIALNLCPSVFPSAAALHEFFTRFGRVRAVRLARGGLPGGGASTLGGVSGSELPGTGVVAFESAHDASCAIEMLDGVPIGAHVVRTMDVML